MKLVALALSAGGAILLEAVSGEPIPIAPSRFRDEADAEAFLAWIGTPCGRVDHLRDSARRWAGVRDLLPCPACETGRCAVGHALCETCEGDVEFDRAQSDHEREPGRNADAG